NIAFVAPVYLLLRDLFGLRAARLGLLLAPLNLWMLHNAWYTWPKMLAGYYLLLSLQFYIQSVRCRARQPGRASCLVCWSGISAALGYMTHQVSSVYVLPLLVHATVLAWRDKTARPRCMELASPALAIALLVVPWYGWLASRLGTDKIVHSTPTPLGDDRERFRPGEIVNWMTFNIVFSVVPADLIGSFFTEWPEEIGMPRDFGALVQGLKQIRPRAPDPVALYR